MTALNQFVGFNGYPLYPRLGLFDALSAPTLNPKIPKPSRTVAASPAMVAEGPMGFALPPWNVKGAEVAAMLGLLWWRAFHSGWWVLETQHVPKAACCMIFGSKALN